MDVLKARLKSALGLDEESVAELAQYVAFQGTPEGMEQALQDILGDGPSAKDIVSQYFENTGQNELRKKAVHLREQEAAAKAARDASPSRSRHATPDIGVSEKQMHYTNFISGGASWGKDTGKAKKPAQKNPSGSGSSTPSSSKVKIDSLADIEAALNQIDLSGSRGRRVACTCMGSRHPLVEAAPNCLKCGKIICIKEGLGPCLSCGSPLISEENIQAIASILNLEKDQIASTMGRKAREAAANSGISISETKVKEAKDKAKNEAENRLNKLLNFQETSSQRTKIIDEVADFETPTIGVNKWASPMEQAKQLKRQQRQLRKQEELRLARAGRGKKVVSIDLHGHKVVTRQEVVVDLSDSDIEDDKEDSDKGESTKKKTEPVPSFWDSKKYGKNFVTPIYLEDVSTKKIGKTKLAVKSDELKGSSRLGFDDSSDDLASSWAAAAY